MQAIDRLRYLEELFVNGVSQSDGRALSIETLLDILIVIYDECCNSTLRREKSISEFVEFGKFSFMILATLSLQCLFQYTTFKTVCKHCLHRYSTGSGHVTFEVVDHYDYGTKDHSFFVFFCCLQLMLKSATTAIKACVYEWLLADTAE